jgi:hypothetical protein
MTLTREQILKPRTMPSEVVPCPEIADGATLTVRRLTGKEFMAMSAKVKAEPDLAFAYWIMATVVNDDGAAVFNADDAVALGEQDATLIQRLSEVAMKLNVNGKGDPAKNSDPTPPAV